MDKKSMLKAIVSHYTEGNKARFANLLGVSAQTISAWGARNTFDSELIYTKCSDISADWLLTGRGSMLRSDQEQPIPQPVIQSTPPGEDSFIYSMYKEEKEGKEALIEEIGGLKERIRTLESKLQEYEPQPEASKEEIKVLHHAKNVIIKKPSSPNADNATSANVP